VFFEREVFLFQDAAFEGEGIGRAVPAVGHDLNRAGAAQPVPQAQPEGIDAFLGLNGQVVKRFFPLGEEGLF
jgi:hypothetical protein